MGDCPESSRIQAMKGIPKNLQLSVLFLDILPVYIEDEASLNGIFSRGISKPNMCAFAIEHKIVWDG